MPDIIATGRRKTSIARIKLRKGSGVFKINGKDFTDYFPSLSMQNIILRPLESEMAMCVSSATGCGRRTPRKRRKSSTRGLPATK